MAGPVVGALYLVDAAGSRARIARLAAIGRSRSTSSAGHVVRNGAGRLGRASNLAVVLTVGLAAMALSATIVAALARARARSGAGLSTLAPAVALGLVVDELVPAELGRASRHRARAGSTRHRAPPDVLPDLSAAIRSIEEGGSADDAAERLRGIAVDLRD